MIVQGAELSVTRQCKLLGVNRSGVYYTPRAVQEEDLRIMRRIDELHLEHPFYGARRLAKQLEREGFEIGRLHVTTLMRRMGIEALYRRARTSIAAREAKIYPYLLGGLAIERANQVWSSDLTYLPMAHGFLYLVAILDVASRKVLSFRLSNTMTPDFCVDALNEAIARFGAPEILNTDQGSQFTSTAWTDVLKDAGVRISMDGKGRWIDNVFIERLWRSVKYEDIYLHAYENGREVLAGLTRYLSFTIADGCINRTSITRPMKSITRDRRATRAPSQPDGHCDGRCRCNRQPSHFSSRSLAAAAGLAALGASYGLIKQQSFCCLRHQTPVLAEQ
jgi:putative transposase